VDNRGGKRLIHTEISRIDMLPLHAMVAAAISMLAASGGGGKEHLSIRPARVPCCMNSAEPFEPWEEDMEMIDHIQFLAAQQQQVEEIKRLARVDGCARLSTSDIGVSDDPSPGGEKERQPDDNEDVLWDEDRESQELLQRAAAWEKQVAALRAAAEADAKRSRRSRQGDDTEPCTQPLGQTRTVTKLTRFEDHNEDLE
jgi:hypothetical protein